MLCHPGNLHARLQGNDLPIGTVEDQGRSMLFSPRCGNRSTVANVWSHLFLAHFGNSTALFDPNAPCRIACQEGNELYRSLSAIGRVCNRFVSWTAASGLPTSTPMESDSPAPQVGMICAPTNPPVPKPTATSTELLCSRFRPSPALNPMPPLYVFEDESTSHPQSPQRADDHTTSCTPNV